MPKPYKMKDNTDKFTIKKQPMFDLPTRLLLVGRTGAGKTNMLGNLMLRPDMYLGDWKPEDIYVFSGSLDGDAKLQTIIQQLEIPKSNLFSSYDEAALDTIYDMICDNYAEALADLKTPVHSLIILDDLSFTNRMRANNKKDDPLHRIACNGRKMLVSLIATAQKYSQLATTLRENASGMMLGSCSNKQLDLIEQDVNHLRTKKEFQELFRRQTKENHEYFVVDYGHPALYKDHDFKPLDALPRAQGKTT